MKTRKKHYFELFAANFLFSKTFLECNVSGLIDLVVYNIILLLSTALLFYKTITKNVARLWLVFRALL